MGRCVRPRYVIEMSEASNETHGACWKQAKQPKRHGALLFLWVLRDSACIYCVMGVLAV